jgi:hypothetical protein
MIDPTVELVWLRRGAWALGTIKQDNRARGMAERQIWKLLQALHVLLTLKVPQKVKVLGYRIAFEKMYILWLKSLGWMHQQTFENIGDSEFGIIERWLREATWVRQHCYEQTFNEIEADMDRNKEAEAKEADLLDRSRLREAYRIGFRRPVSVLSAGIPQRGEYDRNGIIKVA